MTFIAGFVAGECVNVNDMETVEDTLFYVRICLFKLFDKSFGFHSFTDLITVGSVLHFGKAAGTAQE